MPATDDPISALAAMREGIAYSEIISVRKFSVSVRPLTLGEGNAVLSRVTAGMMRLPETARNRPNESALIAKETLALASTSAPNAADPQLTEDFLDSCTPEEVSALFKQYRGMVERCNPLLEELLVEEIKELVEEVKKNPGELITRSPLEWLKVALHLLRSPASPAGN
jgi:hypothetical protein